ncbi:MAG: hypothetical protein JWP27_43 [Flaviaesturariibacter sp.]|nr:hypothetical protein [Flaviaesturariibacter sp.]
MTLQRFQCLSQQAQQDTVKHLGVFLGERVSRDMTVLLYGLNDFYSEIFRMRGSGAIVKVRSFTDTDLLEPYLAEIDIRELLAEL